MGSTNFFEELITEMVKYDLVQAKKNKLIREHGFALNEQEGENHKKWLDLFHNFNWWFWNGKIRNILEHREINDWKILAPSSQELDLKLMLTLLL